MTLTRSTTEHSFHVRIDIETPPEGLRCSSCRHKAGVCITEEAKTTDMASEMSCAPRHKLRLPNSSKSSWVHFEIHKLVQEGRRFPAHYCSRVPRFMVEETNRAGTGDLSINGSCTDFAPNASWPVEPTHAAALIGLHYRVGVIDMATRTLIE